MEVITGIAIEIFNVTYETSPYLLLGLAVAVVIRRFLPESFILRHLGSNSLSGIVKASLVGIPLPLCSCSVVPVAAELRKRGASRAATTSFLVSTPESGVDSILLSYALLGPLMMAARVVSAFLIATLSGVVELFRTRNDHTVLHASDTPPSPRPGLQQAFRYVLNSLFQEMNIALLIGLVASGIITYALPTTILETLFGGGIAGKVLVLLVGIPLYICASSSTPVAAAMIAKGMSPGTALVFLLAGPATNMTSIAILIRSLGKQATLTYALSIMVGSLACGIILDAILAAGVVAAAASVTSQPGGELPPAIHYVSMVIFIVILLRSFYRDIHDRFFPAAAPISITLPGDKDK